MSADPFIQAPTNSQSLNRYSYVLNNPLSMTDPSGFFFGDLGGSKFLRTSAAIIASVFFGPGGYGALAGTAGTGAAITVGSAAAATITNAAIAGFAAGLAGSGGNLKMGFIGGLTGAAFGYIGHGTHSPWKDLAPGTTTAMKVIAHGVVGGISGELGGGDFLSGFLAAGFTQASNFIEDLYVTGQGVNEGNIFKAAIIGGTASVIGGGKFGNGAITGAFSRMFNDDNEVNEDQDLFGTDEVYDVLHKKTGRLIDRIESDLPLSDIDRLDLQQLEKMKNAFAFGSVRSKSRALIVEAASGGLKSKSRGISLSLEKIGLFDPKIPLGKAGDFDVSCPGGICGFDFQGTQIQTCSEITATCFGGRK